MLIMAKLSDFLDPCQEKLLAALLAKARDRGFAKLRIIIEKGRVKYFDLEESYPAEKNYSEDDIANS